MVRQYKDLVAWQRAMDLVAAIYRLTASLPDAEKYGLVSQLRRAAVSVPSNMAEGQGRVSPGEFRQFLGHARGSQYELETQLLLARDLGMIDGSKLDGLLTKANEVGKLLNGLLRSLDRKKTGKH